MSNVRVEVCRDVFQDHGIKLSSTCSITINHCPSSHLLLSTPCLIIDDIWIARGAGLRLTLDLAFAIALRDVWTTSFQEQLTHDIATWKVSELVAGLLMSLTMTPQIWSELGLQVMADSTAASSSSSLDDIRLTLLLKHLDAEPLIQNGRHIIAASTQPPPGVITAALHEVRLQLTFVVRRKQIKVKSTSCNEGWSPDLFSQEQDLIASELCSKTKTGTLALMDGSHGEPMYFSQHVIGSDHDPVPPYDMEPLDPILFHQADEDVLEPLGMDSSHRTLFREPSPSDHSVHEDRQPATLPYSVFAELIGWAIHTCLVRKPLRRNQSVRIAETSKGPRLDNIAPVLFSPGYLQVALRVQRAPNRS